MKKVLIAVEGGPLTETVVQHGISLTHFFNLSCANRNTKTNK